MTDIVLERLHKSFRRAGREPLAVFRALELRLASGTTTSVVGPSGCGKSTLLNIIAGLESFDTGSVTIDRSRLGYLFQRDALLPWRTALDNAVIPLLLRGVPTAAARARALEMFERMSLISVADSYPAAMSGGQRQRVALAQNLLTDPTVLLLDEPFGSLDYQTKLRLEAELLSILREQRDGTGTARSCVFVTHDIEEAIVMGDRLLVLGPPGTGVVLDSVVDNVPRDPVEGRRGSSFRDLFNDVWRSLGAAPAQVPVHPARASSQGRAP